jgi:uncharacterized membrane protein YccC
MAKRAMAIGDQTSCRRYVFRRHQYDVQGNKFESFALGMEDLSMRGQMSAAMTSLMTGMQALNREIKAGVSRKDMTRTIQQLQATMAGLEGAEDTLTHQMAALDVTIGTPAASDEAVSVPAEMAPEVGRLMNELRDEVALEETTGQSVGGRRQEEKPPADDRFQRSMERLRKLRQARAR